MRSHTPVSIKSSQTQENVINYVPASIKNDSPIEEILPLQTVENIKNDNLFVEILPLQTVEDIRDFDLLLRDNDEAITQFVSLYINLPILLNDGYIILVENRQ